MKFSILLAMVFAVFVSLLSGQETAPKKITNQNLIGDRYELRLKLVDIEGFAGLHSFAVAQHDGKWLLIGGRTDGLHRRRPFEAFLARDNNTNIIVIDSQAGRSWSSSLDVLAPALKEQLQSTNMQFIQRGNTLYMIGGYGYSQTARDHVTYDKLTTADVSGLILAIQKGRSISSYFRQISNPAFEVTGGQLGIIGDSFYLVGGQKFEGRYNPMGPDHGPGFFQEYSNQVRRFSLDDDGKKISVERLNVVTDKANLHRRDFNMLPQIFSGNISGFTIFSGVFQVRADLPYTNTLDVFDKKLELKDDFAQYLNHYHCAKVALFDSRTGVMENIFFGGISQYEENQGLLTKNNDVPFTKVIGKVSRKKNGRMTESKIGEMPGFLGAGAEFIPRPDIPSYENGIVKIDEIDAGRVLLGHIVGGIQSSAKSVFFSNQGIVSGASRKVFEVWLTKIEKKPSTKDQSRSD